MEKTCANCFKEIIFQIAVIIAGINVALFLNLYFKSQTSLITLIIITLVIAFGTKRSMM